MGYIGGVHIFDTFAEYILITEMFLMKRDGIVSENGTKLGRKNFRK